MMRNIEDDLIAIANTRLVFNTMDELEEFMDNHSIHSNGIRKAYPTYQRQRSAFRDLEAEVLDMTDDNISLPVLLDRYREASIFYKDNLARKKDPLTIAIELLRYTYFPSVRIHFNKSKATLFASVLKNDIDISILFLLLSKALPSYDSKDGDENNIEQKFHQILSLLEDFMKEGTVFSAIPPIQLARKENHKSRLMLIKHVDNILGTYDAFENKEGLYTVSANVKSSIVPLVLEGYWNEYGGEMKGTDFWTFETTVDEGIFFAIHWRKTADNILYSSRFTVSFLETGNGCLTMYMMHPEAMLHRVNGLPYTDVDHVWYTGVTPTELNVNELHFYRMFSSDCWPAEYHFTRVDNESMLYAYEDWIGGKCTVIHQYANAEYEFTYQLSAITLDYLYIKDNLVDNLWYKVPRNSDLGLDEMQIEDNIGIISIDGKRYLAFDEILLYIEIEQESLKRYGIEKVNGVLAD